ncbi:MAG: winged helix-turn-helix domain-containing tetratricopeptide repeat protein [Burkholderiales bacterium]
MKMRASGNQRVARAAVGLHEVPEQLFDTAPVAQPRIRIGEWWVDRAANELGRFDQTVRIEPKAMEVLMLLAEHAERVVSREELLHAIWPGVIVGDEVLTQSVIKLRRALGDDPRSPSYIETIPKRGYRLIARVDRPSEMPSVRDDATFVPQRLPQGHRNRSFGLAAGILFVLIVAGAYVFTRSQPSPMPLAGPDVFDTEDGRQTGLLTVTVLPFDTVGADVKEGYLARGISHDLATDLSSLSGLRLISASSDQPNVQTALTARYVVSGSVQRAADTLRINIRLIDSRTNEQLWSQRIERPFDDLLAIQNEISRSLVEHLPGTISDAERKRLAKRYTNSPEAYEHFLRGQALFLVRRTEENQQARALYSKALGLDPKFARAYAGLAMTYAMDYRYQNSAESSAALTRALELAETARQIDPDIPDVYWALGFVHAQSQNHDQALKSLRHAIALNPSYADAYAFMGGIYTYMGQPARSIPLLRTALRLNPNGGSLYFLLLGRAYLFEDDVEQALINLREALARNSENVETRVYLAAALVAAGNLSAAEWEADEIRTHDAGFSTRRWLDTYPLTSKPHKERLLELLAKVGL